MSIIDYFAFPKMREQQTIALQEIEANWDKKSIFLLSLPTGTGKSAIAHAVASWASKAYVLTETKQLQDQYMADFDNLNNLKGKDNYQCTRIPAMTAETSLCSSSKAMVKACLAHFECPYYEARDAAMKGKTFLTSYSYFLTARTSITKAAREVIICDEGHVLETKLVEEATIELDIDKIEQRLEMDMELVKFPPIENVEKIMTTLEHIQEKLTGTVLKYLLQLENVWNAIMIVCKIPTTSSVFEGMEITARIKSLTEKIETMSGQVDLESVPNSFSYDVKALNKKIKYASKFLETLEFILEYRDDHWVFERPTLRIMKITPLVAKRVFNTMMRNRCDKMIIMSATLGDPHVFIEEFGIDPDDCLVIDAESGFPVEKSPIYCMAGPSLSYDKYDRNIVEAVKHIDSIIDSYVGVKGIIHTGNYRVCHDLVKYSRHASRMIYKAPDQKITNEVLVDRHIKSEKDTILVSPSMHSGIDLRDDLSRFQIVAKMCYPNLQDARVKAKQKYTPLWYENETMTKIVQATGRSTRHENDYSDTFIVDPTFGRLYGRMKDGLAISFKQRIIWV